MRRIRNFIQGGGGGVGVQIRRPENSLDDVFCFFYSPELILQLTEGVQWFITEETILF